MTVTENTDSLLPGRDDLAEAVTRTVLSNGLRLVCCPNPKTPYVTLNVLYDVGSRDDDPGSTGLAHLFEHLMFGGSVNIPNYDAVAQKAGATNNAFTSTDLTNYYIQIPATNIETAFWLESDRMLGLAFSEKRLEVQRKVVCEEFKQRYLNQPYGDTYALIASLAYRVHPYRWPVIGMDLSHIENVKLDQIEKFYNLHYSPGNAIVAVCGNARPEHMQSLAAKWFGTIAPRATAIRNLPAEPPQNEERRMEVRRPVPADALFMAFKMCKRKDPAYHSLQLLSTILSNGTSSRFYRSLIKEKKLFSSIDTYLSGYLDDGLFIISGLLTEDTPAEKAEAAIHAELHAISSHPVSEKELHTALHQTESDFAMVMLNNNDLAFELAYYELLGNASFFFDEIQKYAGVTSDDILLSAKTLFNPASCSTLLYLKEK